MKKTLCVILSIVLLCSLSTVAFAKDAHDGAKGLYTMGDTDLDGKVTATDARSILRCSVGLDTCDGLKALYSDIDFNGKIQASDARLALRCSVMLENLQSHAFEVEDETESTCLVPGCVYGGCTCCQVINSVDLPLKPHKAVSIPCATTGYCDYCGKEVPSVPTEEHHMVGCKCKECGYFDAYKAYDIMYDHVHENGYYEEPAFYVGEQHDDIYYGLFYDEELEFMYLYSQFYLFDDYGNAIFLYSFLLEISEDLSTFSCETVAFDDVDYILALYSVNKEALNIDSSGAISENSFEMSCVADSYEEEQIARENFMLASELMIINMLYWFNDYSERNDFNITSLDFGFTSLEI